jgi:tetratricopeptide (TPR) repeat protein
MAQWTGGLVGLFVLGLGGLWITSDSASSSTPPRAVRDPLAGRRVSKEASGTKSEVSTTPTSARPFLEPAGSAALAYSNGNYEAALQHYKDAIQKNPQDAESLSNIGQVLVRLGKTQEAVPYFDQAIALIPNRWAYRFNLARALGLLGRYDESIASYREAQQLFPDDYVTTFNLGLALHKKGDDRAAVEEYLKAIALAPTDASFHFALALSYERLRRNSEAIAAYEQYLRLAPNASDAEQVRMRMSQLSAPTVPTPGTPDQLR